MVDFGIVGAERCIAESRRLLAEMRAGTGTTIRLIASGKEAIFESRDILGAPFESTVRTADGVPGCPAFVMALQPTALAE